MKEPIRVTVVGGEETVSFGAHLGLVRCLVAACASEPRTLEDLLLAVEQYAVGTTDAVMQGLLAFDAAVEDALYDAGRGQTGGPVGDGDSLSDQGRPDVPEAQVKVISVVDEATRRQAVSPSPAGLVVFDLGSRRIAGTANGLEHGPILARGVVIVGGAGAASHSVGYVLGQGWSVEIDPPSSVHRRDPSTSATRKDVSYA